MDEDYIKPIQLNNVECKHRIVIPGYQGRCTYIFVFMDMRANTYYWVTGSSGPFTDGGIYSIKAKIDTRNNRLSYVKPSIIPDILATSDESEQPDKPDAMDVLLGLKTY